MILDGKKIAADIRAEIREQIAAWVQEGKRVPKLAVVIVGNNPASETYVANKMKACAEVGMEAVKIAYPTEISEQTLLNEISRLNNDPSIDGFIVQLPLPDHNIVGKPVALLLMQRPYLSLPGMSAASLGDATVTVCHSKTQDLAAICRTADIIIVAAGSPKLLTADMVKEGATVIDVGINRIDDPSSPRGYRLVGDVDFENVAPKAAYITPVPGGVGPMTIVSLLQNTLQAYNEYSR